jgi:glycosyltransferase involved in cell wall biosynthesis
MKAGWARKGHRVRLLHVVSHPIQYFAPLYRLLAASEAVELTVAFCSRLGVAGGRDPGFGVDVKWDIDLTGGFSHVFVGGPESPGEPGSGGLARDLRLGRDLWQLITSRRFDVVWVHGYTPSHSVTALLAARAAGIPVLLREEATLLDHRPLTRRAVKAILLRAELHGTYGLFIGSRNHDYLRRYGIPEARLFFTPYTVDNAFFHAQARALEGRRDELRARWGLPRDVPVALFVGKLIPRKDPLTLLRAVQAAAPRQRFSLLFAGDGELRKDVEEKARTLGAGACAVTGFLNQTEIGAAYAAADLLVLPSRRETWGLVVNEAMNFGLPIIVSDRIGCGADLVRPGENGFVFPVGDELALSSGLAGLSRPEVRRCHGEASRRLIEAWSPERSAAGVIEAAEAAFGGSMRTGEMDSGAEQMLRRAGPFRQRR